jgi:hypothetical protein
MAVAHFLPVKGTFSPKVQSGPGVHPALYSRLSGVLSPGVKWPQRESDSADVKKAWSCAPFRPMYLHGMRRDNFGHYLYQEPAPPLQCMPRPHTSLFRSAAILYPCVQTDLNRKRLEGCGMETLAQGTDKWRAVVNTVMNRQVS